jgi:dephospho-CoA kinase
MFTVGLTGGIGSGKSTFAALLAERGAQIIDADEIGRDALRPGEPAWHSTVDTFGDEILVPGSMEIDRKRLAEIVFKDPAKLAALNAITHPVITRKIADDLERLSRTDEVVVLDAALIVELGLDRAVDVLIVVDAKPEIRRQRLTDLRHMDPIDVDARMASQTSSDALRKRADLVVRNDSTVEDLALQADHTWQRLQELARG